MTLITELNTSRKYGIKLQIYFELTFFKKKQYAYNYLNKMLQLLLNTEWNRAKGSNQVVSGKKLVVVEARI